MLSGFFPVTTQPHLLHSLLEALAILVAAHWYRRRTRLLEADVLPQLAGQWTVLTGCLLGAALGNKLVFWLEVPHLLPLYWDSVAVWLSGQSMVGGLLGGLLGVELAKKWAGVTRSTGDAFVFPLLLGLIIGRLGCFLAGLADGTYGLPSDLPWAVDFGDGLPRHPTQLYEIGFALLLWAVLGALQQRLAPVSGLLFKVFLSCYLLWRLVVDALKPVPFDYADWLGLPLPPLSGIQLLCVLALVLYLPLLGWQCIQLRQRA
jgi:prolipoprotein diacylglyceryltransferase